MQERAIPPFDRVRGRFRPKPERRNDGLALLAPRIGITKTTKTNMSRCRTRLLTKTTAHVAPRDAHGGRGYAAMLNVEILATIIAGSGNDMRASRNKWSRPGERWNDHRHYIPHPSTHYRPLRRGGGALGVSANGTGSRPATAVCEPSSPGRHLWAHASAARR